MTRPPRPRPNITTHTNWRKSSYSAGNEGECVEIATNLRDLIAIPDSKNSGGPALVLTLAQWAEFLDSVKQGKWI